MANEEEVLAAVPAIAKLALKHNLIQKEDLLKAVKACEGAEDSNRALIEYLLKQNLMTRQDLQRVVALAKTLQMRQKELRFGTIAVEKGFITKSVLQLALDEQREDLLNKRKPRRIGDILVEAGLFTAGQRDSILEIQNRSTKKEKTAPLDNPETKKVVSGKAEPEKPDPQAAATTESQPVQGADATAGQDERGTAQNQMATKITTNNLILEISSDLYAAFLTKTDTFDDLMSVDDIKNLLIENNIVFGIVADELIEGFLKSSGFKTKAFRVALGSRPVMGKPAKIEYFFNTDHLKAGGVDKEGNIDFKDRGEIPLVEEGTVLAEKTPAVRAKNGRNVFGEEIVADPESDVLLKYGKGTRLSEDGLKILATVSGHPKFTLSETVFVHEEYLVEGDVDYETGHVEYIGNVMIKGCIKNGFKVSANNITAQELDGGIIHAEGDLTIAGGINEATIYAKGNVRAKFIHTSSVLCMGNIHVEREIVDSTLESYGACLSQTGKVISSKVTSKMGVFVKSVGTESTEPCLLKIGHDPFMERELVKNKAMTESIQKEIGLLNDRRTALETENKKLQQLITEYAQVQDRSQLRQREIAALISSSIDDPIDIEEKEQLEKEDETLKKDALDAEKKLDESFDKSEKIENAIEQIQHKIAKERVKIDDLIIEKNNLIELMKSNPANPCVEVSGIIIPGTAIIGKHSEKRIQEPVRNAKIREVPCTSSDGTSMGIYEIKILNR